MSHDTVAMALVPLQEYGAMRQRLFPSDSSLSWYVRQHKAELVEAGAIVKHLKMWHAVPERFDAVVIDAGTKAAQKAGTS